MGLQSTQGNEKLYVASCLSSRAERPQGAESRDLHFPRLPCLVQVLRMFFNRERSRRVSFVVKTSVNSSPRSSPPTLPTRLPAFLSWRLAAPWPFLPPRHIST